MCGLAGFERRAEDFEAVAQPLLAGLAHRGPDGAWAQQVGAWGLVQTRLAVVDLSPDVRYPMPNESGDTWLLFNGEIYNHPELRRDLESRGHSFRSRCDAEVIVHGYEEWGDDVFPRLNGMWAVALVDERKSELVLARDARGVKPLVRTTGERFAFSSEAMALVAAGLSAGQVDHDAVAEYAAFHYVPPPATGLDDVEQVPPGTLVRRFADGRIQSEKWSPRLFAAAPRVPVSTEEADRTLRGAVERQLRADVAVGVFLSGGIDSALLLAHAVDLGHRPAAFTVGFESAGDYDETVAARQLAHRLGVDHHVDVLKASFATSVDLVGRAFDSPFGDPSAIATLPLAQFARGSVTVALTGTGGDDLFAGYYRHRATRLRRLFSALPSPLRSLIGVAGVSRGSERTSGMSLAVSYAQRLAASSAVDDRDFYMSLTGSSTSRHVAALLLGDRTLHSARAPLAERHGLPGGCRLTLDQIQEFELETYLAGDLLVKEDRATMAWGLEGRVPWLDNEVALLAARTPEKQRATLWSGKVLLRRVARQRLGRRVARIRKRGFAVPLGLLLSHGWKTEAHDWLGSQRSELVDCARAIDRLRASPQNPLDLWALSALLAWEQRLAAMRTSA